MSIPESRVRTSDRGLLRSQQFHMKRRFGLVQSVVFQLPKCSCTSSAVRRYAVYPTAKVLTRVHLRTSDAQRTTAETVLSTDRGVNARLGFSSSDLVISDAFSHPSPVSP